MNICNGRKMAYKFNFKTIVITHKTHRYKFNSEYPDSVKGKLFDRRGEHKKKNKCRNTAFLMCGSVYKHVN